jgi:pyridoxamine 5'-phosphate oxidase
VDQFHRWFEEAVAANIEMANAMALATVDEEGAPHARMVLLKDADTKGFVFFTNYESHKARDLAACNKASLLFWWHPMTRQIRIEGSVEKVSAAESDAYFRTRPRASNLAAMASPQSRPVESREALEKMIAEVTAASPAELERPAHWGGYRLAPTLFEFWQGRPDRSHDRIEYRRDATGAWSLTRLCP